MKVEIRLLKCSSVEVYPFSGVTHKIPNNKVGFKQH